MRPNQAVAEIWDGLDIEARVIDECLYRRPTRLSETGDEPRLPSFYLIFFDTLFARRRTVAQEVAHSARLYEPAVGYPIYAGSAANGRERLARHRQNTAPVPSLAGGDALLVINVVVPTHAAALYAEALLLKRLRPVWNVIARGFGSRWQGARRETQVLSRWGQLHSGRRVGTGTASISAARVRRMVTDHLLATVVPNMWSFDETRSVDGA